VVCGEVDLKGYGFVAGLVGGDPSVTIEFVCDPLPSRMNHLWTCMRSGAGLHGAHPIIWFEDSVQLVATVTTVASSLASDKLGRLSIWPIVRFLWEPCSTTSLLPSQSTELAPKPTPFWIVRRKLPCARFEMRLRLFHMLEIVGL